MRFPISFGIICLIFLCSCATQKSAPPPLPAEISLKPGAGRGDWIRVKLRLENGRELSFTVDTGASRTVLDKSLEPILGKRLGTRTARTPYGIVKCGLYNAPGLYLGNSRLLTANKILTGNLRDIHCNADGILGMDCLRHYCIQLDFAAGKMRLLDPNRPGNEDFGEAFPLTIFFGKTFARGDYFGTGNAYFRVDTGDITQEAVFSSKAFRRALKEQKPNYVVNGTTAGTELPVATFSKGIFGAQTYSDMIFVESDRPFRNLIGLPFLARNLVTFNFPKRIMYLRQESAGSLDPGNYVTLDSEEFLLSLRDKGQLPGWSKNDKGQNVSGEIHADVYPVSGTFDIQKKGGSSVYHYTVSRASNEGPLKLEKAWQTDVKGKIIREYSVP